MRKILLITLLLSWSVELFAGRPVLNKINCPILHALHFEDSLHHLYDAIGLSRYDLSYDIFRYGMIGYYRLVDEKKIGSKNLISIIDFTKASTEKRFYTIDLGNRKVLFNTYVSHGKNTGENMARSF